MKTFTNPYLPALSAGRTTRLTTDVDTQDYNLIKTVRVASKTITTTINILIQKLCYELRARGITDITKCDEYEHFIVNLRLTCDTDARGIGDPSPRRSSAEDPRLLHGGGTSLVGSLPPAQTNLRPVLEGRGRGKRTRIGEHEQTSGASQTEG